MRTILHEKKVYIPLLIVAGLAIVILLMVPFLPQVQSKAQAITKNHPALAKIAPKSFKPPDLGVPTTGNWLVIPDAGIKMPINEGPSIDVLIKNIGVWHQTGDIDHNYAIAGHRLQYFRTVNQTLYHLDVIQPGNTKIYVVLDGKIHQYKAVSSTIVAPTDVGILDPTATSRLTIYTCNDFQNHSRLVLTAEAYQPKNQSE